MLAFFITANFYVIVITAMLYGNSVTVYFNHYNEAIIEYIIYTLIAPIIFYAFYMEIRLYTRKKIYSSEDKNAKKKKRYAKDNC